MTLTWLVPLVTAGLFGSAHCIGMCGGLIMVASDGTSSTRERVSVQAGYQAARLFSYVVLGLVAGSLGRALDLAGQAAGLGKAAAVLAGVTMSAWGAWALLEAVGVRHRLALPQLRLLPSGLGAWLGHQRARPPWMRAALLGGASALLPCGFLYAFALAGAATGTPLGGALVMGALWLGNLPALVGFGFVLAGAMTRLRRHIPVLSATTVLLLGLFTLNSRVNLPAFAVGAVVGGREPAVNHVAPPSVGDCPHHRKQPR